MALAKYWRVWFTETSHDTVGLGEVQMFDTIGGANLCVGGTPTAHQSFVSVAAAFNGNFDSLWYGDFDGYPSGRWIKYEFLNPVDIVRYLIASAPDGQEIRTPTKWIFQSSVDDIIWIDEHDNNVISEDVWEPTELRYFNVEIPTENLRLSTYSDSYPVTPSYGQVLNDNERTHANSFDVSGWETVKDDVYLITFNQAANVVGFVRCYFMNAGGVDSINAPSSITITVDGALDYTISDLSSTNFNGYHTTWVESVYIDVPINAICNNTLSLSFTGIGVQAFKEIDVYDSRASIINTIAGKTTRGKDIPCSRLILAHDEVTGLQVGSTISDERTGEFTITYADAYKVFIRVIDEEGIYNSELRENLTPVQSLPV